MPLFVRLPQLLHRRLILAPGIALLALGATDSLEAATMQAGNVTTALGPTFFVDDAVNGGTDTDIHQDTTGPINFDRHFNGQLTRNQGSTRVALTGFGFATHTSATANDATAVAVTITYLGQDEAINGGDDVVVGTATGSFVFTPSISNPDAEYVIVFDTPLTAELNVTGTRFQVRLAPSNAAGNGSLKLKSGALAYETSSGAKLSVAGIASPRINPQRLNLAKFQTVTASSTAGQYRASYLTDGVTGNDNRWQGSGSQWQAAQVDFPFAVEVGSAQVFMGVDDASAMSTIYLQHFNGSTWVMIPGVPPLGDFVLKYWDGTAWQNLAGATVTGNSAADRIVSFTTPIITSKVRLEFTNPGTTAIRELCIFPANTGNTGYPIGTNIIDSGKIAQYEDYHDAFYRITHPSSGRYMAVPSGGQPALDQAGVTTEQGHYQVLLNLSNGTYRLRNRATGDCLSGAQLAKTPGLPLTDAPYLALPHQDWILETLGGGNFQLVNQWSGLVIDTQGAATSPGTVLVQNTADQSPTQRWRFSYSTWSPKKGIGGSSLASPFAAKWFYNWGLAYSQPVPADALFHPMQWGNFNWLIGSDNGPNWQYYPAWRRSADAIHHLGFNEPDGADQSNIPVNSAIALWPRLQEMDQPLLSPAPAGLSNGWLDSFYTQAGNLGYRVDYTGVHNYPGPGGGSSDGLIGTLQTAYNNWQRPVWLTEFSFVDWNRNASWSEEDTYQTLAEFLWRAESPPWLRKYALFVFTESATHPQPANPWQNFTPAPRSNSYDMAGNLTAFGKLYAAWDNDTTVRTGKPYYLHHKTSHKRLANLGASGPNGRSIRVDGPPVNWTLSPTGTSGRYYIVSSVDGRRLSSANGAAPTFAAAGAIGPNVEWTLTGSQHGWFYIGHPASSRRLQLVYNNNDSTAAYSMALDTIGGPELEWRFIVPPPSPVWSGLDGNSWTNQNTWVPGIPPTTGESVIFNETSVANLATVLDQNFSIGGLTIANPAGPVSIGGSQGLTVGAGGIDLSAATQNLTLAAPTILGAAQTWNVAAGRTLAVNGGITGGFPLTINGAGTTTLGGAVDPLTTVTVAAGSTLKTNALSVLPSGPAAGNPSLQGALDLNGTSQSVNLLTGSGSIDNTYPNPATLTIGNNNAGGTLNNLLQDTNGPLTLIKTGTASLTLPIANTHGGGFTNNGAGTIFPQNSAAFGSGPVVMNGATIYATVANFTFTNSLALNGAILRVGGSNSRTLVWSGPVTATGNAGISADGGTSGVTLGGSLDIAGATFTSTTNGNQNTINGPITGAGGNLVALGLSGVLQLAGDSTYGGTTTIGDGSFLRLTATGTLPPSSNIINNGGLTIRNTVSWVHNGTITGDDGASISLNTGTNATLAGSISGITSINVDHGGTDATISGAIGGSANINVLGTVDGNGVGAILRLGGSNTYSGTTTITRGKIILAAANVLPDSTAVTIGNATLDAGTFTDSAGTLDVTSSLSTIQLGTGAALAFANSSAVSWTGGNLRINGAFVPGFSIRFGSNDGGLTSTQIALIRVNGSSGPFVLNSSGFLTTSVTDPYDLWKSQITNGQDGRTQDAEGDGFTNQLEFLFGTSPVAGNGALLSHSVNGANFVLRWVQRSSGATYVVEQSPTLAAGSWLTVASPIPAADPDQAGVPVGYVRQLVALPLTGGARFYRISATEN